MARKMSMLVVVFVVVGLCSSGVFALDPMGAPSAQTEMGKYALGIDYMFSDMDLGGGETDEDENLQVNKVFGVLTYGVMQNVEIFGRAGIGHAEGDEVLAGGDELAWGSTEFIWGAGARATLMQTDTCEWGAVITFSQFKSEEHAGDLVDFDELQIAFGPTVPLSSDVTLFGGPMYHNVDGDTENDGSKSSINEDGLGGYFGARFRINENACFSPEFQFTDDAVGFGVCLIWMLP